MLAIGVGYWCWLLVLAIGVGCNGYVRWCRRRGLRPDHGGRSPARNSATHLPASEKHALIFHLRAELYPLVVGCGPVLVDALAPQSLSTNRHVLQRTVEQIERRIGSPMLVTVQLHGRVVLDVRGEG